MSFFTCFCDLPQNEHLSSSPPSPNFATVDEPPGSLRGGRDRAAVVSELPGGDHLVDDAVFLGLVRGQYEIAVGILVDLLDRLAGVVGDDLAHEVPHPQDLL